MTEKHPPTTPLQGAAGRAKRLQVIEAHKFYDNDVHAVNGVSLDVQPGEFLVLVGPSGCGKSTMLRLLAGLEELDGGDILLDEKSIARVPPKHRDVAMVFQNYALYPTMRVYDNMAFPLKMRHWKKEDIRQRVLAVAAQLGIEQLLRRRPAQLSGGQRQRVALGRAMVREPALFLMDEPLSNLDAELRVQTRHEIVDLQRKLGITTVYVTHDQVEAMTMGTRIAVLKNGFLQQYDSPQVLYNTPGNTFVARFIGSPPMNIWLSTHQENQLSIGSLPLTPPSYVQQAVAAAVGSKTRLALGLRPEDFYIQLESRALHEENFSIQPESRSLHGKVHQVERVGRETFVYFELPGWEELFICAAEGNVPIEIGQHAHFAIDWSRLHLFDADSGLRLPQADPLLQAQRCAR